MKFLELINYLEKHIGYHHIPLNQGATTLQEIFDGTPVQSDFVIKLVRGIYKTNSCSTLNSKITQTQTENCLAKIRNEFLQSKNIDIDTFNFIDDMCFVINKAFLSNADALQDQKTESKKESNIISIKEKSHLRWLKSSA